MSSANMTPAKPGAGEMVRWAWPAALLSLLILAIAVLTFAADSGGLEQTITEMLIRVVVVVGMYVFIGNSGILSFGHIGFMAIGAYASAWLTCCTLPMVKPLYLPGLPEYLKTTSQPFLVGIVGGAALAGAVALVVGAPLMRLRGIGASIATFALLAIINTVYGNWDSVTAGASSIANIPVVVSYWVAAIFAIAAIWIAYAYQQSKYGLMLRAVRDDEVAANASGAEAVGLRLGAFVLSGALVGVGGVLHANFLGILTIDAFYLGITFLTLAMLIIGGIGSLTGAVIGVVFVTFVVEVLRALENGVTIAETVIELPKGLQEVGLGLIMIVILLTRPAGLTKSREIPFPFGRRRGKDATPEHPVAAQPAE